MPIRLEPYRALVLELLEGLGEEVEPQNGAFVGKQIVADVDASHRRQVASDDPPGNQPPHLGPRPAALLQIVQGLAAELQPTGVVLVPLAHFAVDIPADESKGSGRSATSSRAHPPHVEKTDHHVGQLHPGVVDVVLDLDGIAQCPVHPHQHVAQGGVAQVADVSSLVRIDIGVLDDHLLGLTLGRG